MGYEPVKRLKGGAELWYLSPFRDEGEPSFVTSYFGKWIWNDFGDTGGTVIDFVMRHEGFHRVSEALHFLRKRYHSDLFRAIGQNEGVKSFRSATLQEKNNLQRLELLTVTPVKHLAIWEYLLEKRCLPSSLIERYLREITYCNHDSGKIFFAFGMENHSGGYEIRSASDEFSFKSALNGRDVSFFQGSGATHTHLSLFEGMTDFISLLALRQQEIPRHDVIVLHSLSSIKRLITFLDSKPYQHIYTYFDNNRAGQEGTRQVMNLFTKANVISCSHTFAPYTDLNDVLVANIKTSAVNR